MLLMWETHRVHGTAADDFEALYRDRWMPQLAKEDGVRLAWYFNHAHGTSGSFNVVTVTALRGWVEWERVASRARDGDLRALARELDGMRYAATAKLLEPLDWSPVPDLERVPVEPQAHGLELFIEDTVTLEAKVEKGFVAIGDAYPKNARRKGLSRLVGAYRPVHGGGRRREAVLLQRVIDLDLLATYYLDGAKVKSPPWSIAHDGVPFADSWQTRVLRASSWSPLS